MAFAHTTEWEVISSGSDTNGGGFDPVTYGLSSINYSLLSPVTYVDLTFDGTNLDKATSLAQAFSSTHTGNVMYLSAGTRLDTEQRAQIIDVTANVAQFDRNIWSAGVSATDGYGILGGALSTVPVAVTNILAGGIIYIKGNHSISSAIAINTPDGTGADPIYMVGYATNRTIYNTDTQPVITQTANAPCLAFVGLEGWSFHNLKFCNSNGTKTGAQGFSNASSASGAVRLLIFHRCIFGDKTNTLLNVYNYSTANGKVTYAMDNCELCYCTGSAISYTASSSPQTFLYRCYIHHNNTADTGTLAALFIQDSWVILISCIVAHNRRYGVYTSQATAGAGSMYIMNNVFYKNDHGAIQFDNTTSGLSNCFILNNIFYASAELVNISMETAEQDRRTLMFNNAFGGPEGFSNTIFKTGEGAITLTGDPFVNGGAIDDDATEAAAADYALITTGAGLQCRAAGWPTHSPQNLTDMNISVGVSQNANGTTSAGGSYTFIG